MQGYLSLVLHAHLPFVRHPEHEKFLEENWLFEAITETYVPLLQMMERWQRDGMDTRLTLTLTPTLCAMLRDPLLQHRYDRHLNELIELAEKEIHRTHWDKPFHELALLYHHRFTAIRDTYCACGREPRSAPSGKFQELGRLEIITSAATHALLPLLADHPPSIRAQILVARDHYRSCFGRDPRGIWLPECAYVEGVEDRVAGGEHPLVHHRHARPAARATAAALRRVRARSSRPTASPRSAATSIPPGRSGASTKVIPATRATAISTATSASTSISIT